MKQWIKRLRWKKHQVVPEGDYSVLVTKYEVMSPLWREMNPRNCPIHERTGDGIRVGACWFGLKQGVCPRHGQIYEKKSSTI